MAASTRKKVSGVIEEGPFLSDSWYVRIQSLVWMGAVLLFFPLPGHARRIGFPTSEQLNDQAMLVCNGTVISTESAGPNQTSIYDGGSPQGYSETWMSARVKVLHIFKGAAASEFVLRYRARSPGVAADPPIHIRLIEGERYRFFLKPGPSPGQFLCVLDGRIDDGFGIQTLCPDEAEDSRFLGTAEAVKIARNYLHLKKPHVTYDPALTSVWPWPGATEEEITVAASNNSGAEQATVWVFRDRTIDEKSTNLKERR